MNHACILFEAGETRSAYGLTAWDTFLFKGDSRLTGRNLWNGIQMFIPM
jgi:hypothetical protein